MPENRQLSRPDRQWRAAVMLGWPLALVGAPILLALGNVPLCAFRKLSGQPCPLCGATHACAALVEGDFLAAWQANPGVMVLLAIAFAHSLQLAQEALSGRRLIAWRIGPRVWMAGAVVVLLSWAMRLVGLI